MAVWKEHCEISKVVNFETTLLTPTLTLTSSNEDEVETRKSETRNRFRVFINIATANQLNDPTFSLLEEHISSFGRLALTAQCIYQGHPTNSFCKISVRETKLGYTFLKLLYDKLLFSYLAGDLQSSEITEEGLPFSGIREISEEGLPFSVIFRPFKISASIFRKFQKFSPAIFCMVKFFLSKFRQLLFSADFFAINFFEQFIVLYCC